MLFCNPRCCYDVLKVSKTATSAQIKKAFKQLYRPIYDALGSDALSKVEKLKAEQEMESLTNALKILTNKTTRTVYDLYLTNPFAAYEILNGAEYVYPSKMNMGILAILALTVLTFVEYTMKSNGSSVYIAQIKSLPQYTEALEKKRKHKLKKKQFLTPATEEELSRSVIKMFPYDASEYEFRWSNLSILAFTNLFARSPSKPEKFKPDFKRFDVYSYNQLSEGYRKEYIANLEWQKQLNNIKTD